METTEDNTSAENYAGPENYVGEELLQDIYTEQGIEVCIDNDEITDEEEGFMAGWISA
jgi:hypothetical protein